jgi:protocatechuate 3,4-dioxygenase beta subunit
MKKSRRKFIRDGLLGAGLVGSALGYSTRAKGDYLPKLNLTPNEIEGPFYPVSQQKDQDFDLTQVEGRSGSAKGQEIWIHCRVLDSSDLPVEDATVDLWQANAAGRYRHPHETNDAPLDPNFQGWSIVPSGSDGGLKFKTIMPGSYPASRGWSRPPHIHFKVTKKGYVELITQMYFPEHPLNEKDLLLQRKGPQEQKLMIAIKTKATPATYSYQIVLQKA